MGLSFKKNIDDYRLSHGVYLTKKLIEAGYSTCVVDKDYGKNDYTVLEPNIESKIQIKKTIEELDVNDRYDTVIISLDNKEFFGHETFLKNQGKILDLWNMYKNKKDIFNDYWSLGLGIK